jgi:hypothetical protein
MASIRPFERADLPAVTALMEERFAGWTHGETFLAATLLDHPWAEDDLPSYVAVGEADEIIGFIGIQVRRMRLDERSLRAVVTSHLVVSADRRAGYAGTLLLRQALAGPQDLTWTDSATDRVLRLWRSLGGHMNYSRCYSWMFVLKPLRWLGAVLSAGARRRLITSGLVPVGALPIQAAGPRLVRLAYPAPPSDVDAEDATVATMVAHLPTVTRDMRLRPDYDQPYLEHLLAQVEASTGPVVRRIVHRGGRPIGCYVYARKPGGLIRVLHLAALAAETDAVVGELIERARADGATVLTGRAEPHLHESLRRRLAVFGSGGRTLIHSRDPEIESLLATSSSLLTHLDGEWFAT